MKHLTKEEYKLLEDNALAAKELLEDDRFAFFRDFLNENKKYVEDSILNNTIKDVREELTVSEKLKRTLFTPKQDQLKEMSGEYKFINHLFNQLNTVVGLKKSADELISKRRLKVSEPTEDISG